MAQSARLGSAKFAALHKSVVQAGTFLWIPRGVEINDPFEVFTWSREMGRPFSRTPWLSLKTTAGSLCWNILSQQTRRIADLPAE